MKRTVFSMGLVATALVLGGCTGGTTYGTGSSHEGATMKGLGNIFSLKNEKQAIEYRSRPELVLPANKNILPAPVQTRELETDQDWPETPEQRIAKVRADAPTPNWKGSEDLPVEYLGDTNKAGIGNSSRVQRTSRKNTRSGSDEIIKAFRNDANGVGEGKLAKERREQLAYSTGVKRKFLTEPPVEYRVPSANAEAGDLGIDKEVLTARQKQAAKEARELERGVLSPQGSDF